MYYVTNKYDTWNVVFFNIYLLKIFMWVFLVRKKEIFMRNI